MSKPIQDASERERALDPNHSFIVQAPAGSGKTELLTQRYLKLLACVHAPEEILAITFTKKAASEMRSRIRDALLRAQNEPRPEVPQAQKTWDLAAQALKQDKHFQWDLLANPNRLRIKTIDAFNTLLTHQLPLLSHFGASPDILDYPQALYREAVQTFLAHLEENLTWSNAIAELLLHLDNNVQNAEALLIEMLNKRDHWLPYIMAHQDALGEAEASGLRLRQHLENNLAAVISESLSTLRASFPPELVPELLEILHFACGNLKQTLPASPLLQVELLKDLPGIQITDIASWRAIADFLLTKEENFRKSLDKNLGFPPNDKKKTAENERNQSYKERMKALLTALSENDHFHHALVDLLYLPAARYEQKQWKILKALHEVLKIVVAQLAVIFKQSGKIDYTENALAALMALGNEEAPTDLALVLDYQLKHILIDEFQDTSNNQYELIKKLVTGWQEGDGRTLFLVGDPMQSIYRFREADVGLFLRARMQGLGEVHLQSLKLSVNFRSQAPIVEWINSHFNHVLPLYDDMASGAVSYTASTAYKEMEDEGAAVELHTYVDLDEKAQAQALIPLLKATLAERPEDNIAILVRSRNHLLTIIPALKAADLAYQAVEIDPLHSRPLIQDLLALTRALAYPADAVAWLAILRAPWCGLSLSDFLLLAGNRKDELILERLSDPEYLRQLSQEGQDRLQRILPFLEAAIKERYRDDLYQGVEKVWIALGGPACLTHESDLQDAKIFFSLLKKLGQNELRLGLDLKALEESIQQLYAQSSVEGKCRIQIMTIHNAKGLEFDTVILPQLQRGSGRNEKTLLTWLERPLTDNSTALLLAPIHESGEEEDSIYHHIRRQDKNKTQFEQSRLLYVAATRAKKALHLLLSLELNDKGEFKLPPESSMLKKLWPAIKDELHPEVLPLSKIYLNENNPRQLKRLSLAWQHPAPQGLLSLRLPHNKIQGFHLNQGDPQALGTVIHYLLQQLAHFGLQWWQACPAPQRLQFIEAKALQAGIGLSQLTAASSKVELALHNMINDPRGRWILQPHQQAASELAMSYLKDQKVSTLRVDRTFIDEQNVRWIIDYKTTAQTEGELSTFLEDEKSKHAAQLKAYAEIFKAQDSRPIACGLYFPLIPAWYEWLNV